MHRNRCICVETPKSLAQPGLFSLSNNLIDPNQQNSSQADIQQNMRNSVKSECCSKFQKRLNGLFPYFSTSESNPVHMYALTHGLEYIMRYIFRVIFYINCTRRSRVQLIEKMTRKIYLIMNERPCVNVFNARITPNFP